jgi:hypothetical protein
MGKTNPTQPNPTQPKPNQTKPNQTVEVGPCEKPNQIKPSQTQAKPSQPTNLPGCNARETKNILAPLVLDTAIHIFVEGRKVDLWRRVGRITPYFEDDTLGLVVHDGKRQKLNVVYVGTEWAQETCTPGKGRRGRVRG